MTCTNCGKPLTGTSPVAEEGYYFCNNICRLEWRKKGKPSPFHGRPLRGTPEDATIDVLEFPVDPPGFENRQMRLRLSYWTGPKIFLDGKLLEPVTSGFLGRKREYRAASNFGKEAVIRLQVRPLDQIPRIEIDGQPFTVARPLSTWEYIWMSLPAILLFSGGIIGGAMGMAAVFSNSILMRRVRPPLPRYLLTGATTAMAFFVYVQFVSAVNPFLTALGIGAMPVDTQIQAMTVDINKRCPITLDKDTRLDSTSSAPGKILTYHYTLVNYTVDQLDVEHLKQYLRPGIISNIRTNQEMSYLRQNEVTFVYRYADKNQHFAFDLQVSPEEYR